MTQFGFGVRGLAPAGRVGRPDLGVGRGVQPSMLVRAVTPIPTVAWLRKLRRLMKVVGSMVRSVRKGS